MPFDPIQLAITSHNNNATVASSAALTVSGIVQVPLAPATVTVEFRMPDGTRVRLPPVQIATGSSGFNSWSVILASALIPAAGSYMLIVVTAVDSSAPANVAVAAISVQVSASLSEMLATAAGSPVTTFNPVQVEIQSPIANTQFDPSTQVQVLAAAPDGDTLSVRGLLISGASIASFAAIGTSTTPGIFDITFTVPTGVLSSGQWISIVATAEDTNSQFVATDCVTVQVA